MKRFLSLPPVSFLLEAADLYGQAGVARSAAALSYFLVLTLFPLLVCVNYFIGLFHLDLEVMLRSLDQVVPPGVLAVLEDYLGYVSGSQSDALLMASLITILISASAGLRTLLATLDEIHRAEEVPVLRRVLVSVALSALFLVTVYLSVVVIFTGEWFFWWLRQALPPRLAELIGPLSSLWQWMRYLLLFCFVLLLILIVYRAGTPRGAVRGPVMALSSLGPALAIVAASVLFSWFIGMSSRYALVYGSLASLIILLAWLYLCGNILLLGAVAGRVLEDRLRSR